MKVGVLSGFIPSKKNKPKCLLAATAFEKVYTSFFFYSHSAKSAFLITTTKNHLTGSLETTGCQISHYRRCQQLFIGVMSLF